MNDYGKPRECDAHFLGFFVGSLVIFWIVLVSLALGMA